MPAPNDMNDAFVEDLLAVGVRLQKLGVTNNEILLALRQLGVMKEYEIALHGFVQGYADLVDKVASEDHIPTVLRQARIRAAEALQLTKRAGG